VLKKESWLLAIVAACGTRDGGARVEVRGDGATMTVGASTAELPREDGATAGQRIVADATARRLAYTTASGGDRIVYRLGDALFVGPVVAHPADFVAAPTVDHALAPLFDRAGPRRAELVRELRRERGEEAVVRLLEVAAFVDDATWEETRRTLGSEGELDLRRRLAEALVAGRPSALLRRALEIVDLAAPEQEEIVRNRTPELVSHGLHATRAPRAPRVGAAFLRALLSHHPEPASKLACAVVLDDPRTTKRDPRAEAVDRGALLEAAFLAVAAAGAASPCANTVLERAAAGLACMPEFRCSERASPDAEDAPCTAEQLARVVVAERARTTRDVLTATSARPGLLALAALSARNALPSSFAVAHARRRYTVAQPDAPACDPGLAEGTPCRCDEAALRLAACQASAGVTDAPIRLQAGRCRFEADDRARRIGEVVAAPPSGLRP
jgi:hypothetical protein